MPETGFTLFDSQLGSAHGQWHGGVPTNRDRAELTSAIGLGRIPIGHIRVRIRRRVKCLHASSEEPVHLHVTVTEYVGRLEFD